MPVYEYECDGCMKRYNLDVDALVKKLNKTNANSMMKGNSGFTYIELRNGKSNKIQFALGERVDRGIRRFKYNLDKNKVLYLELKDFKFSSLIYNKKDEKDLICPTCNKSKYIRRVFSTFKAIFDDKNKRAPRPGDDLKFHLDYKIQKDEEIKSDWVGPDHLTQYFNR